MINYFFFFCIVSFSSVLFCVVWVILFFVVVCMKILSSRFLFRECCLFIGVCTVCTNTWDCSSSFSIKLKTINEDCCFLVLRLFSQGCFATYSCLLKTDLAICDVFEYCCFFLILEYKLMFSWFYFNSWRHS